MWLAALFLIFATIITFEGNVSANLSVIRGAHVVNVTTTDYRYYGARNGHVTAEATFVRGQKFCEPSKHKVEGKIVVVNRRGAQCELFFAIKKLVDAGVVGIVFFVASRACWNGNISTCYVGHTESKAP